MYKWDAVCLLDEGDPAVVAAREARNAARSAVHASYDAAAAADAAYAANAALSRMADATRAKVPPESLPRRMKV
jgi:hypothetical protein